MDVGKKFLALVIPKSWIYIVLMEAHDELVTKLIHTHIASSNANIIRRR